MSAGVAFAAAVSALAGATVHPYEAALIDKLRGRDGTLLDFAAGHALQRAGGAGWLRPIGDAVTFGRASAGGRWPAEGPYEMVGAGALRLDHDPITRAPLGVLIEGAHSPISQGTADFSAAGSNWSTTVAFAAINAATSIFAGGVAAEHVSSGASSQGRAQSRPVTAGANYRLELIVERTADSYSRVHFGLHSGGWLGLLNYNWDTDALTVTAIDWSAATGLSVEQLGTGPNGGKLVRIAGVINTLTATTASAYIYPNGLSGAAAGQSCIIHYACVSPAYGGAAPVPSPLIVPVGATQARAADSLVSPLYCTPAEAFTIVVRGRLPGGSNFGDSNTLLSMVPPSGFADRVSITSYGYTTVLVGVAVGGVSLFAYGVWTNTVPRRDISVAFSWSPARQYRAAVLGGAVSKFPIATPPGAGLSRITWGTRAGSAPWGGTIERAAIWAHDDFDDIELAELTA